MKRSHLAASQSALRSTLRSPCVCLIQLSPVQLKLYEPVNSNRNAAYSQQSPHLSTSNFSISSSLLQLSVMCVTGYSVEQDPEVKAYKELERAILASESQKKEVQRQKRLDMGLPDPGGV